MTTVVAASAQEVLKSLYADGVEQDADWSKLEAHGVENLRERSESGDSALQTLMGQLALDKVDDGEQAKRVSAMLGGIKQFLVHEILEELPTTTVEDLRAAADKAGYDLEVIG